MLKIKAITNFTLQDFPNYTACIIWFNDCNMRCQYCHNVEFLNTDDDNYFITENKILSFLKARIGLLDGVVLSGGECTLAGIDLIFFIKKIKALGFKVKIDTNGINFPLIKYLVNNRLLDFIALDYKATKAKYKFITNNNNYELFYDSLKFLINANNNHKIDLEIRTTVHIDLLNENDINVIIKNLEKLNYKGNYYIQNFRNDNKETFKKLNKQSRDLDKSKVRISKLININYRNFF